LVPSYASLSPESKEPGEGPSGRRVIIQPGSRTGHGFRTPGVFHVAPRGRRDGGPSVLYDAVVLMLSEHGGPALAALPVARDFVADAYAHCKFIGYTGDPDLLFAAAGLLDLRDDGFVNLNDQSAADVLATCAALRFWPRQASIAEKTSAAMAPARKR
jgi:catalase